jgi:hypothetical protein
MANSFDMGPPPTPKNALPPLPFHLTHMLMFLFCSRRGQGNARHPPPSTHTRAPTHGLHVALHVVVMRRSDAYVAAPVARNCYARATAGQRGQRRFLRFKRVYNAFFKGATKSYVTLRRICTANYGDLPTLPMIARYTSSAIGRDSWLVPNTTTSAGGLEGEAPGTQVSTSVPARKRWGRGCQGRARGEGLAAWRPGLMRQNAHAWSVLPLF